MKNLTWFFPMLCVLSILLIPTQSIAQNKKEQKEEEFFKKTKPNQIGFRVMPVKKRGIIGYPYTRKLAGQSKEQLYKNAVSWFVDDFSNYANGEFLLEDEEAGLLFGRGHSTEAHKTVGQLWNIWFDVSIKVKDGSYRFTISNFQMQVIDPSDFMNKYPLGMLSDPPHGVSKAMKDQTTKRFFEHIKYVGDSLKEIMKRKN